MARFTLDPDRVNFSIVPHGKEYNLRVLQRARTILSSMMSNLPSSYLSTIQGPNYTNELKAVAVELARIELALEDIDLDRDYNHTRTEFLYSIIGYLIFINGKLPGIEFADEEFRKFLLNLITIFFRGAVPTAIRDACDLLLTNPQVYENFLLTRMGASGYDISSQFGFQIDVETGGVFPADVIEVEEALRIILNAVRPAHTLFTLRHIFRDTYNPNDPTGRILDAVRWEMANHYYEDFRSYWKGVRDVDRLGKKTNQAVVSEVHTQYVRPASLVPILQFITPNTSVGGGELILLNGANFLGTTNVQIGGLACSTITVLSSGEVSCFSPSLSSGVYNVVLSTSIGSSTLNSAYTVS